MKEEIEHLNKTIWCKIGVSSIHGVGVFAIRDIQRGTVLTDYNIWKREADRYVYRFNIEDLLKLKPEVKDLILDHNSFKAGTFIFPFFSPNQEVNFQSFMNHSENPNTDGFVALRDIMKGEELTENYSKQYPEGLHIISKRHFNL